MMMMELRVKAAEEAKEVREADQGAIKNLGMQEAQKNQKGQNSGARHSNRAARVA